MAPSSAATEPSDQELATHRAVASRAAAGPLIYALTLVLLDWELGLWRSTRAISILLLATCAARQIALDADWWSKRIGSRAWQRLFTSTTFAMMGTFGTFAGLVISDTETSAASTLVYATIVGFVMGAVYVYAPRRMMARVAIGVLLGIPAVSLALGHDPWRFKIISLLVICGVHAHFLTNKLHREHWQLVDANAALVAAQVQRAAAMEGRLHMERELQQAQKLEAIGRLASGVAHEINTPLQFIATGLEFLRESAHALLDALERARAAREDGDSGAPVLLDASELAYLRANVPTAFDECFDGIDRVAGIVGSMREFAHPGVVEKTPVHLHRSIEAMLTIAANEYRCVADVTKDFGDMPPVLCHRREIEQAVLNIIVNAAHAIADRVRGTNERGTIAVRTHSDGDRAVIVIRDTGGGIPEAVRDKIFDPFFTTKGIGRGTGQGLAIARAAIVEKHDGKLRLESTVGVGTTFFIELPLGARTAIDTGFADDDEPTTAFKRSA